MTEHFPLSPRRPSSPERSGETPDPKKLEAARRFIALADQYFVSVFGVPGKVLEAERLSESPAVKEAVQAIGATSDEGMRALRALFIKQLDIDETTWTAAIRAELGEA